MISGCLAVYFISVGNPSWCFNMQPSNNIDLFFDSHSRSHCVDKQRDPIYCDSSPDTSSLQLIYLSQMEIYAVVIQF